MGCGWLLKRLDRLAALVAVPTSAAVALVRAWSRVAAFLNGAWPPWVSNVANVVQIGSPAIALLVLWLAKVVRSRSTEPAGGAAARLLGFLVYCCRLAIASASWARCWRIWPTGTGGGSVSTSCCRWRAPCQGWG
jgi:hypothetical protein